MKKFAAIFVLAVLVMSFSFTPLFSKRAKLEGTWEGTTVIPTGEELAMTLMLEKIKRKKYKGSISDATGMLQDIELQAVKYKKKKLTCYFDFQGTKVQIELKVAGDKMTGSWFKEDDGSGGDFTFKKKK